MPAQLTQRPFTFFNPSNHSASPSSPKPIPAPADGLSASKRRLINIQAGLAELMLLNRLRARTRRDRGGDTLERAAQIIEVTSRHWFAEAANMTQAASAGLDEPTVQLSAEAADMHNFTQR